MLYFQRIRRQRGAAALEALLSMVFLVGVFFTMWSVSRVINEQSRLDTSTQLATRAALQTYMRNAPAGCVPDSGGLPDSRCALGLDLARSTAANVLSLNMCGPGRAVADPNRDYLDDCFGRLSLNRIGNISSRLKIECAGTINPSNASAWKSCQMQKAENSRALRVTLEPTYETSWSIFTMVRGLGMSGDESAETITSKASAFSYSPRTVVGP